MHSSTTAWRRGLTGLILMGLSARAGTAPTGVGLFTLSLEELMQVEVVTASRKSELADEAPNVMYVFTRDQIRRRGYRTLKDLLVTVPGFGVFYRDLQWVAQVRGIAPNENEKVSFMINGRPINQVTEPEVLMGPLSLELVERVEIIVGPGSVLYGADTLCAIVNLILRQPEGPRGDLAISAGNDNAQSLAGMAGQRWGERRWFTVGASWMRHDGWDAWRRGGRPGAEGTRITGQLDPSLWLVAEAQADGWNLLFSSLNQRMPEINFLLENDMRDARRLDYLDLLEVSHRQAWSERLDARLAMVYENKRLLRTGIQGPGRGYDLAQQAYRGEYVLAYRTPHHYLQAGLQAAFKQNRHNYDFNWDPDDPGYPDSRIVALTPVRDTHEFGAFVSEEWSIARWLRLIAACRADRNSLLNGSDLYWSPRLAAIARPHRGWISKLIYNRATRMPSPWMSPLNEAWGRENTNPDYYINPLAEQPEKLATIEWQNILYLGRMRAALNLYHQELTGFIAWFRPFTNAGDFEGDGAELDVRIACGERLTLWGNLTATASDFEQTAKSPPTSIMPANAEGEMAAVPRYTGAIGADWLITRRLYAGTCVRGFTRQPAYDVPTEHWYYVRNRAYLDVNLSWEDLWDGRAGLRLCARNLLDNDDEVAAAFHRYTYAAPGTQVDLTLTVAF